ncbi:MAG: TonB-dependent receptor [Alteromonadaceae bacterium]|nr:TonB-dependent receptor [Alteromonadaceae bacterium]
MKNFAFSKLNSAVLKGLYVGSMAAALTLSHQAFAQENEDETADVERVMVTGSRIARDPNLAAPSPVQAIEAEDIQTSGEFSIADVVNDIPALFSSTTAENSGDFGLVAGSNRLNLRGLGSNRTLVLVNGRRHIGGAQGSSSVDVGSIPTKLIESVEVLTGGASAIYGADAVTGVVNFILKKDFEGFDFDIQQGVSSEGDSEQTKVAATYGFNFDNDKGNFAVSLEYSDFQGLQAKERDGGVFVGSGRDWVNPAKRFQQGDIDAGSMPNFAQYYNPANDRPTFGLAVPGSADDFIASYTSAFGMAPTLTAAELAYIQAAAAAPNRAVLPGRTFPFTSGYGYVIPGNPYTFAGFDPSTPIDLNGNGTPDCYDSWTGYNSVFGTESFGVLGGCWVANPDGTYRVIEDGLVANGFQGFGGDSFNTITQQNSYLLNPEENIQLNLIGSYELTDDMLLTWEAKHVSQETYTTTQPTSFWDLLFGAPDNPYLPAFIQPIAQQTGGVAITIDPIGIGDATQTTERETTRLVLGINGEFDNGWVYDASYVYGRFNREVTQENAIINDRFMAAIDAVIDPATGEAACRVDVDPTAPAQGTPFNIPDYDPGYFSFTPGAGQCVPLNIWAGQAGITDAAAEWVTTTETSEITLTQHVIAGSVAGDLGDYFELPAGPIEFAFGGEYRKEESEAIFDPWQRGVLPAGSPFVGGNIADISDNTKLTFRPKTITRNETGEYDVWDIYVEAGIPLLEGMPFAESLGVDVAFRISDYDTIGKTETWKVNLEWFPIEDLMVRSTISQAVRAPNITELFGPLVGTTFRPADPCDAAQISALRENGQGTLADQTQANCVADFATIGLDPFDENGVYSFSDPLSAAFGGFTGGNVNLQEETADTQTYGFVYRPDFIEGFNITVDHWIIEIEDAIAAVSGQNIADGCYQGPSLNQNFCSLLGRNSDSNSIFFGGFNTMTSTSINFAKLETSGWDFAVAYDFNYDEHEFGLSLGGTKVNKLNQFSNPLDLSDVDPELGEIRRPEWAGNASLSWTMGDLNVNWQTQYQDEQLLQFVEIETAEALYGDAVMMEETFIHDINMTFRATDELMVYGGINNITDEMPFITNAAYPASIRGRYFFLGLNYTM